MNLVSLIGLQVEKDGVNYHIFIPNGTSYETLLGVLDDMKLEVSAMLQAEEDRKKEQEGAE